MINYFDGSLRSRQTVSKLESEGHVIATESVYDHVGRPVVQAMPAPFILGDIYAQNIDYYDNFNMSGGVPYNREHFEIGEDADCSIVPDAMDTSGSGQYYDPSNTITDGHQAYVPDAAGYPFSQTIYTHCLLYTSPSPRDS